jgi:HAD superfamily hydrolase (TIGR01450 family)
MDTITHLEPLLNEPGRVLGLDAYGVLYNGNQLFHTIIPLIDYCNQSHIPVYIMTNNATQSVLDIYTRMTALGIDIKQDHIISSGCGCYILPELLNQIKGRKVFVYGYPTSVDYALKAGGILTDTPTNAEVIIMAASTGSSNHLVYQAVFQAIKKNMDIPVICINPDHYILYKHMYMPVMGFYAHQMALQLGRKIQWMGKPHANFSTLISSILKQHGHQPKSLLFCDDNPWNVHQMVQDLDCKGCVITDTGVFHRYKQHYFRTVSKPQNMVFQAQCSL